MREIKFKAFHKLSKRMFNVYCFTNTEVIENSTDGIFTSDTLPALRQDCELLQYTGLKDCEGKEIYEGDIVVIPEQYIFYDENKLNYVGVVESIFSSWQYVLHCVNKDKRGISTGINEQLNNQGFNENETTCYKVIGNIYQNPELLECKE